MLRFRPLMHLAVPIISARVVQNLGFFVGSLMVAQLGKAALAASAIATSLSLTTFIFASSSLMILAPLLSGMQRDEHKEQRERTVRQGITMATIMGLLVSLILFLVTLTIPWWDTSQEIKELLQVYFWLLIPGNLPMLWTVVFQQYLLSSGRQRSIFWYSLIRFFVGTLVSYLCIFGFPGLFPGLGFHGLGLGVTLGSVLGCAGLGIYTLRQPELQGFALSSLFRPESGVAQLLRKAVPIGVMSSLELAAFATGVQLLTPLGEAALGAHQIVFQFVMLGTMIPYGLCDAVALSVGQARGEQNMEKAREASSAGGVLSFIATGVLSLVYLLKPEFLAHLFLRSHYDTSGDVLAIVIPYFQLIAFYQVLDGSRLITIGALRGRLNTTAAMTTSLLTFWVVALPLAALLILGFDKGPLSLPLAMNLGMIAGTIAIRRVYARVKRNEELTIQKSS